MGDGYWSDDWRLWVVERDWVAPDGRHYLLKLGFGLSWDGLSGPDPHSTRVELLRVDVAGMNGAPVTRENMRAIPTGALAEQFRPKQEGLVEEVINHAPLTDDLKSAFRQALEPMKTPGRRSSGRKPDKGRVEQVARLYRKYRLSGDRAFTRRIADELNLNIHTVNKYVAKAKERYGLQMEALDEEGQ